MQVEEIAWLGGWGLYYALHSLLAASAIKRRAAGWPWLARHYRLIYNLFALGGLLALALAHRALPALAATPPSPLRSAAGALLLTGGAALGLAALRRYDLGEFSGLEASGGLPAAPQRLLSTGLHAWVRHPLYTATLLGIAGLLAFSPAPRSLAWAALSIAYLYAGAKLEERKLEAQFGEAYRQYRARTPMLLPWPPALVGRRTTLPPT
jgi:protein-S-isoprenylcysteine O-methyltransferase Ste14